MTTNHGYTELEVHEVKLKFKELTKQGRIPTRQEFRDIVIPHIRIQRDETFTLFDTAKTKPLSKATIGDKLQELRDKILDNTLTEDDMKFIQLHTGYDKDWFFINIDLIKNTKTVVKQQLKLLKSKETLTISEQRFYDYFTTLPS